MSSSREMDVTQIEQLLQSFLDLFKQYSEEIFGNRQQARLDELRSKLQRMEPKVTHYVIEIVGHGTVVVGSMGYRQGIAHSDLLATALMGGNNELSHNFRDYESSVEMMLNRALGNIEAGLWPPEETEPTLVIRDTVLRQRCFDLLGAPGNFDRVIREATVILEDRIRNKVSHDTLTRLIPTSGDQIGENLINKLFSPDDPVIIFSDEKDARIAFRKMLIGINAFLRNPYHHRLDDKVEWSWAWSIIGFIDQLLFEIENCRTSDS